MSNVIVTIRCIVYNHEPFLRQCLDGFVMQQTNFPFEAIVHDDASTDGSAAIIREYAEKYPDIIKPIIETENQYSKRDGSIRRIMDAHTRGKYVAYCEGDDYWTDPLKLQKQVDFLESHPDYSMCFHKAKVIAEGGRDYVNYFFRLEEREYKPDEIVPNWMIPTASIVRRADVYVPTHKDFRAGDEILRGACIASGRVYCFANEMSVYRLHMGGWTNPSNGYRPSIVAAIPHYLAMMEVFPPTVTRALKPKVSYFCYYWIRNYLKTFKIISPRYLIKAALYCNTTLLFYIIAIPFWKAVRLLGGQSKSFEPYQEISREPVD